MKNSKLGFSLIEILAVFVILSLVGIGSMLILSSSLESSKEVDRRETIERIESAASVYLDLNEDLFTTLYEEKEIHIRLGILQEEGYIPYNLIDPVSDKEFSSSSYVYVTIDENEKIKYTYEFE